MVTDAPEMRMLSANRCPNWGPDYLLGPDCNPEAVTMYGYCGNCWQTPDRVPRYWRARVEAYIAWEKQLTLRGNSDGHEHGTEGGTVIQFPRRRSRVGVRQPRPAG